MKESDNHNFTIELSRVELLKIRGKGPGDENPGGGPIILPPVFDQKPVLPPPFQK
jgi:hypothetical protein